MAKKNIVYLDISDKHFKLLKNSNGFKEFKEDFNPLVRHKRFVITPGDYIREHIISYYRSRRKKIDPKLIYNFDKGKLMPSKIRFALPDDVMKPFEFDATSNFRTLRQQALYLVIPLLYQLDEESK